MDVPATVGAGLIAGAVMAAVLYTGIGMMPNQMKMNLFYLLGSMMFGERGMIYLAGAMIHAVMSVLFAFVHVGIYEALGLDSKLVVWGLLFGFVHYLVAGWPWE